MAEQWYYSQGDERQGPVSLQQLMEMAASGKLQPTDLVWRDGMSDWGRAESVRGLFETQPAGLPTQPPPPLPPSSKGQASEPTVPAYDVIATIEPNVLSQFTERFDPATLQRRISELRQALIQYILQPKDRLPDKAEITTFQAEHARLQDEVMRLRQRQQQLVEAKAEFETLDAARQRSAKDLSAAENDLKQLARPLGKAAFEAILAGQLQQNQPIFGERSALRDRIAELNVEYDQLAPPQDAGIVQKTKAKAQQLVVAGRIKAEEMTVGKLDEKIGWQLITSNQEQSVACDLTAEPLVALRKQRDLIAQRKQESEQAREALETNGQRLAQSLDMPSIEGGRSFDAEKRNCERQITQAENQRSVLEKQLPEQLLACDIGQGGLGQLLQELRQAQAQREAPCDARNNQTQSSNSVVFHPLFIAASMFCCFPGGLVLTWIHPVWRMTTKLLLTGVVFVFFIFFVVCSGILGQRLHQEHLLQLQQANTLWDAGKKGEACVAYETLTHAILSDEQKQTIYERLITFHYEGGRIAKAKELFTQARRSDISPVLRDDIQKAVAPPPQPEPKKESPAGADRNRTAAKPDKTEESKEESEPKPESKPKRELNGDPSVDFDKLDFDKIDYSTGPQGQKVYEGNEPFDDGEYVYRQYRGEDKKLYKHGRQVNWLSASSSNPRLIMSEESYAYGRLHGKLISYSRSGATIEQTYYNGDLRHSVFWEGGEKSSEEEMLNGEYHGWSLMYKPPGRLISKVRYEHGKAVEWKRFDAEGMIP